MPRPIDRTRLRAELLTAGRVLTDPLRAGLTEAHRLGALDILLQRIAWAAGEPDAANEIDAMLRARHELVMAGHRERLAALAPLASDEAPKRGDVSAADEDAYFDSLDAEPPLERDRRTSEVAT